MIAATGRVAASAKPSLPPGFLREQAERPARSDARKTHGARSRTRRHLPASRRLPRRRRSPFPANSRPPVGPANLFSNASSGRRPMRCSTSRKLTPVARTRTDTTSAAGPRDRDPVEDGAVLGAFAVPEKLPWLKPPSSPAPASVPEPGSSFASGAVHSARRRAAGFRSPSFGCSNLVVQGRPGRPGGLAAGSRSMSRQVISARSFITVRATPHSGACHGRGTAPLWSTAGIAPDVATVMPFAAPEPQDRRQSPPAPTVSRSRSCPAAASGSGASLSPIPRK